MNTFRCSDEDRAQKVGLAGEVSITKISRSGKDLITVRKPKFATFLCRKHLKPD
jgi:hypothetical protein